MNEADEPASPTAIPMPIFTDSEAEYLKSQRLARLATTDPDNAPHVVPVSFRIAEDGATIDVGGGDLAVSKKYRDLQANPKVAIVIDDLASVEPWTPRGRGAWHRRAPRHGRPREVRRRLGSGVDPDRARARDELGHRGTGLRTRGATQDPHRSQSLIVAGRSSRVGRSGVTRSVSVRVLRGVPRGSRRARRGYRRATV
jgi:pyridoxamine 5'-phosphate oxidase family protein